MEKITRLELIDLMAEHDTFDTKRAATEVFDILIEAVVAGVIDGKEVYLGTKLGGFAPVDRAAREGVNPTTGEKIQIPAKTAVKFNVSASFKDAVA